MTKMMKLSERLRKIADQVPAGSRVADIGSDHALLPSYLVLSGRISKAIAGEVNSGPLEAARKQVQEVNLQAFIEVRGGDGLAVIQPGEVNVITIAGMGGSLIVKILSAEPSKLEGIERLVLQPNIGEDTVRRWLLKHEWQLIAEDIVEEDGKIYEILTAIRSNDAAEQNANLYRINPLADCGVVLTPEHLIGFGPWLLQRPNDAFVRKWQSEQRKLERICETLQQSDAVESRTREEEFKQQIRVIEEVLQCLRKDRP